MDGMIAGVQVWGLLWDIGEAERPPVGDDGLCALEWVPSEFGILGVGMFLYVSMCALRPHR